MDQQAVENGSVRRDLTEQAGRWGSGEKRGRGNVDSRSLKSITLISRKHDLDPKLLIDALTEAWRNSVSRYGDMKISCREIGEENVTFLMTRNDKVVSQFPVRSELLKDPVLYRNLAEESALSEDIRVKPGPKHRRISELRPGMKRINVIARIVEVPPKRLVVSSYGNQFYVSNVRITDDTGSIRLSLWNGQIDLVQSGNEVEIMDCYVANFGGEPQLRIGRSGSISVLE